LAIIGGLDAIQRIYNRNILTPSIEGVMLMQVKYIVYDTFQATYYTTVLPLRFLQVMRADINNNISAREINFFAALTERVCILRFSTVRHGDIYGGTEFDVAVARRIFIHLFSRRVSILQRTVGEKN
jgi:hypothetical protein